MSFLRKFWKFSKKEKLTTRCYFLKIFKNIIETLLIDHSIGYFILKNFKTGRFLMKMTCEEIWRYNVIFIHLWTVICDLKKVFHNFFLNFEINDTLHMCTFRKWRVFDWKFTWRLEQEGCEVLNLNT